LIFVLPCSDAAGVGASAGAAILNRPAFAATRLGKSITSFNGIPRILRA
jgi:hypothetical protein